MILQERIQLLAKLGEYMLNNSSQWEEAKYRASAQNAWFTLDFIEISTRSIAQHFLQQDLLEKWVDSYFIPSSVAKPKNIGVVMAGNIPLVGFHDFLCVFISGHTITIKASSKDEVLLKHLVEQLGIWQPSTKSVIHFADNLKGCDAYIATGSNNSSRYFDYYFGKYPNIIRRNRTSVAVLDGTETKEELELLADDIQQYFGQGCRNVTKLYVPERYDFIPLLEALRKFDYFFEFHKYKHNYDYQLAILIMGNTPYLTNGSVILTQNDAMFTPVSRVNYSYYTNEADILTNLKANNDIQCIIGHSAIPFGKAQQPQLTDYADGIDTLQFLKNL